MFKLESYITPLLMGYLDQYVKLRPEDLQLSLWGGDAVLYNLDLRLDVLEKILQLPITFSSGHIHELRLHVPWTKLGSEPIVVTINTVECILKVRDTAYEETVTSVASDPSGKMAAAGRIKKKVKRQTTEELPPGYLQSIVNRMVNNMSFIVNNLIIKFVEDDIVFSMNVKSAESYSCDQTWKRAFVDVTPEDLVLRKVINFSDLTVCLDKSSSDGRIDNYQEPMLYRCFVMCRLHMAYDSLHAKFPCVTRLNILSEKLECLITDTQLPMFIRLMELFMALYFGYLDIPSRVSELPGSPTKTNTTELPSFAQYGNEEQTAGDGENVGWAAWMWSMVPQILLDEEDEKMHSAASQPRPPVFAFGFYIKRFTVTFKLTEQVRVSGNLKLTFHPVLVLESTGLALEVLMQGSTFFDTQFGITHFALSTVGPCICGSRDKGSSNIQPEILVCGEDSSNEGYYTLGSLFDSFCGTRGEKHQFVLDSEEHMRKYTESYGLQRFGAFWFDYISTLDLPDSGHSSSSSDAELEDSSLFDREQSMYRFTFGQSHIYVSSSAVHRIQKFLACACDHHYEPYKRPKAYGEEQRLPLTENQVKELEEFLPTCSYHLTLFKPSVTVLAANHPECSVATKAYSARGVKDKSDQIGMKGTVDWLEAKVSADRFDMQMVTPMYPGRLARLVSNIAGPSSNLMYHCHSHTQLKVFSLQAALSKIDPSSIATQPVKLLPPYSAAFYSRCLVMPHIWKNSHLPLWERSCEIPQVSLTLSKVSLMATVQLLSSWTQQQQQQQQTKQQWHLNPSHNFEVQRQDLFPDPGTGASPVLELTVTSIELRVCSSPLITACTGSLSSIQLMLYLPGDENESTSILPLLYGPVNASMAANKAVFEAGTPACVCDSVDCFAFLLQKPQHTIIAEAAPAVVVIRLEGLAGCLDPGLLDWFAYMPHNQQTPAATSNKPVAALDLSLAQATSPLQVDGSRMSVRSSSSHTVPNTSRVHSESQAMSKAPSSFPDHSSDKTSGDTQEGLGQTLSQLFPLLRMLQVQVDIQSSCIFVPKTSVRLKEPSVDIASNIWSSWKSGQVADVLVICLPAITVRSVAASCIPVLQDIPVTTLDGSLLGDKLPWTVHLSQWNVFSLHASEVCWAILEGMDLSSTVGVTVQYDSPTSDTIHSLALCVHLDITPPEFTLMHKQVTLGGAISSLVWDLSTNVMQLYQHILNKLRPVQSGSLSASCTLDDFSADQASGSSGQHHLDSSFLGNNTEALTGDQLEDVSQESGPVQGLNVMSSTLSDPSLKVSAWLQLVMPRCTVSLHTVEESSQVKMVLEDFAVSCDVQQVYHKLKMSLGSISIHKYRQTSAGSWQPDVNVPVLLSTLKHLPQHFSVVTNKLEVAEGQASHLYFSGQGGSVGEKRHGFLSLTYTRALCKNVLSKIKKLNVEVTNSLGISEQCIPSTLFFHKWLSEICLKVEAFDAVFHVSTLEEIMRLWFPLKDRREQTSSVQAAFRTSQNVHPPKMSSKQSAILASHVCPLVHADISCVRVFLLTSVDGSTPKDHEVEEPFSKTTLAHDMLLLQLQAVHVQPYADNPLPRYALERELFHCALQAGLTQQAGFCIEDRQYQLQISAASVSSGTWAQWSCVTRDTGKYTAAAASGVQFPALEWNTYLGNRKKTGDIEVIPMVKPFNVCLVVAPPIVFVGEEQEEQGLLVCGLTAELNVKTDLEVYLSAKQLQIMMTASTLISQLITPQYNPSASKGAMRTPGPLAQATTTDSGIESDLSHVSSHMFGRHTRNAGSNACTLPVDILLTAGRVSLALYAHQQQTMDYTPDAATHLLAQAPFSTRKSEKSELLADNFIELTSGTSAEDENSPAGNLCSSFDIVLQGESSQGSRAAMPTCTSCVQPFVFVYIAQPHALVKFWPEVDKVEISCYDILVKGAEGVHVFPAMEHHILPDHADFNVYWLETRAGKPNTKTGIPPCLLTFSLINVRTLPGSLEVKVERPVKLNVTCDAVQQTIVFLEKIFPKLSEPSPPSNDNVCQERPQVVQRQLMGMIELLEAVDKIHISTEQIVISLEAKNSLCTGGLLASVIKAFFTLETTPKTKEKGAGASGIMCLKDVLLKTMYQRQRHRFAGPASIEVEASLRWPGPGYEGAIPQLSLHTKTGLLKIYVGQEHVLSLQHLYSQFETTLSALSGLQHSKQMKGEGVSEQKEDILVPLPTARHSQDDLRSGSFVYSHHADSRVLPAAWEIMFNVEDSGTPVRGAMIWSYPEPRVIRRLVVLPIPLVPFPLAAASDSLSVPCVLQCWDECRRDYVSYAYFNLSENKKSVVDIPEMKGGELMRLSRVCVSRTWRIAVLTSDGCDVELPPREEENGPDMLALVTSLAASVSVDSCAVPELVPVVQASLSVAAVHLHLSNHIDYNGSGTPDKLKPFRLTPSVPSDEEWAMLMLSHFSIFASHIAGLQSCTSVTVSGVGQIDILDYKQLVMETFLSPVNLQSTIVLKHKQATMPLVEVRVKSEKVSLHMGRSIMHSLNVSLQSWKTFGPNNSSDTIFFGHIIVCNNTQETLRFGQVDTDENLALQSNHMTSYSWRSGSKSRQLHLCLDKATWRWCAPVCVETEGCAVRVVRAMDQHYTLIIKIRRLSPVYMQLIVSGQLVLSNQLSQPLELNLTLGDHTSRTESTVLMDASSVLPTLVMEHEHVCAIRVRFLGGYNVWSDLVKLRGKTVQENQLLKMVLPDGKNFIHVWCHIFSQRFSDAVQKLEPSFTQLVMPCFIGLSQIVFSPLFVLRSHLPRPLLVKIETPSSRHLQQVKLHGQGQAFQLYCKGESTAHHLSFKLGPDLPHSCPPVVLSDSLVQQVKKPDMIMVDIDQLCQQHCETKEGLVWPCCTPCSGSLLEAEQPSMDLNIHLSQHKAGCSTVLVDIAPWCLLTNTAPCTLVLIASGHRLHVPSGSTIAPPKLQEFSIGFERSSLLFETRPIKLSEDEQIEHRYSSDMEDVLLLDGQVYTQLLIPPEREGGTAQVLALSASSNYVQGIRMLTVSQQFTFINSTAWDLEVRLLAVPEGTRKVQQSDFEHCLNSSVVPHSNEDNRKQLLVWQMMGHASSHLIFYIMLKLAVSKQTAVNCEGCASLWSVPVRVPWTREGSHNMVAVPRHQEDLCCSIAVSMTCHKDNSGLYIMLTPDNAPMCILHNLCPFVLQFGQGLDKHLYGAPEMVLEETELLEAVPHVASWGWCHYTMPHASARFPAIDVGPLPPLHMRVVSPQTPQDLASHHYQPSGQSKQISPWSPGISLSLANTFVQIPAVANMKVSIQVISMVKHVTFSLVSKAEISSTAVLQHAKSTQRIVRMVDSVEVMEHKVAAGAQSEEAHTLPVRSAHHPAAISRPLWPTLTVELHLEAFSFTLWDDSHADILSEALYVHLDHVLLTCYPVGGAGGSTCMALCLGDVHAYNPKAHLGHFDFPVIFMSEKSPSMLDFKVAPGLGMAEQHAMIRAASVVQLQFVLSKDIHYTEGIVFESVLMGIKPVRIYVEDTFIFYLMKECAAYMPVSLSFKSQLQSDFSGHATVQDFGYVGQPLRIQHVCLQACNILLSVHASVKMFLATDHTPLTFAAFERQSLFTSAQQLLYSVAMHYITSAIFRAGMVVGSLDILGSPTGLVRSVRLGMTDFVRLPYQGLIQGPLAFVTGVRGGTASLLRNVTAGVVTSVTNFASSVSRNMDRLSLDDEHRERQEETRRRQPSGLSSGLWQGLSGFGLSLLGAVAGLVDQPIQTVLELEEEQKLTKRAGHLMAGVGKGLIGIITKPLGGAAELVSQTGQGLLQGAGLRQPTSVRQPASDIPRHSLPAAMLKYSMKMLPDTELILAVSATQEDLLGELVPVVLLLTSDMLTVVSCEDDAKQQAFDLLELDCFYSKPDVLTLTIADAYSNTSVEGGCGNEDLVAAFVSSTVALLPLVSNAGNDQDINDTQKCGQLSFLPTEVAYKKPCNLDADVSVVHTIPHYFQLGESKAESADIEASADLINHSRVVSYDLRLPVDQAHLLLSAFCQAKRNKLGKGFLV